MKEDKFDNKIENRTEDKTTFLLTTLICLIPVIAGLILLPKLPEEIVTHWSADGTPNGWSHKITGAVVYPGILVIVNMILPSLMKVDPRYSNMTRKTKALVQWIIPVVSVFCSATTLANGLGVTVNLRILGPMFMGLIIACIGNYLPKMTQSYTLGIKLPWTLNSEDNWNKTHRMAGFVWMLCGLLIMAGAFLPGEWGSRAMEILLFAALVIPAVYSYLYYRKTLND